MPTEWGAASTRRHCARRGIFLRGGTRRPATAGHYGPVDNLAAEAAGIGLLALGSRHACTMAESTPFSLTGTRSQCISYTWDLAAWPSRLRPTDMGVSVNAWRACVGPARTMFLELRKQRRVDRAPTRVGERAGDPVVHVALGAGQDLEAVHAEVVCPEQHCLVLRAVSLPLRWRRPARCSDSAISAGR